MFFFFNYNFSTSGSVLFGIFLLFFFSCKNEGRGPEHDGLLLKLHDAKSLGISFVSQVRETEENSFMNNAYIYVGGGVSILDYNLDGLQDIYFSNVNGEGRLYKNKGDFQFEDVTEAVGLSIEGRSVTSASIADVNLDGFPDLYCTVTGKYITDETTNLLFVSQNGPTYKEEAVSRGVADRSLSDCAAFFDYDLDGDLDLVVGNRPESFDYINKIQADLDKNTNSYIPNIAPKNPLDANRLFQNQGDGNFKDVTDKSGLADLSYTLSVTPTDVNGDGFPDLYFANDFVQSDRCFINNKNGTFTDQTAQRFSHTAQHSMGTDVADYDNDGLLDIFTLDMLPPDHYRQTTTTYQNTQTRYKTIMDYGYFAPVVRNVLQRNNGNGTYSDLGCMAGIEKTDWSWSCLFADFDHDGLKDLSITNGYRRESSESDFIHFELPELGKQQFASEKERIETILAAVPVLKIQNYLYKNNGNHSFANKIGDWAEAPPSWSNGAAYADLDNDGDLDLVINNLEETPFVYENLCVQQQRGNWLIVKLQGEKANPDAYGALIELHHKGQTQLMELNPTRGIFSSVEPIVHFGLGNEKTIDSLIIHWPKRDRFTLLKNVATNQRLTASIADAGAGKFSKNSPFKPLFKEKTAESKLFFQDVESGVDDFDAFFTLPWRLSDLTPLMSSADVNGDGLKDVFIGNQFDQSAAIFLQNADGTFQKTKQELIEQDKVFEDSGSLFYDADGDGDQDLLLLGGGWDATAPIAWQPRLFLNNGQGIFDLKATEGVFPKVNSVCSKAVAYDYDKDGDLDLFIGGRIKAKQWPSTPASYVFQFNGGTYKDVSDKVGADFRTCGMITDLEWADLNGDKTPELIALGEWMNVSVFEWEKGQLKNKTDQFGLSKYQGLWNCLEVADLNKDGRPDLVCGNLGLNTRYEASEAAPLQCYYSDFDKNGSIDPIMAYWEDGKNYPLIQRDLLIKQLPYMKKKFVKHRDFGKATMTDVFSENELKNTQIAEANVLETVWFENTGSGFKKHNLPVEAQIAPTQAIIAHDFNGDGHLDLFLTGNKFGMEVETNRCDAGIGCMLLGDGKGSFKWMDNRRSGIFTQGDVRDALLLENGAKKQIIVSSNNGKVQVFGQ